ncbi:MAG TPA: YdcF family protein [Ktedonobacteraceae bacterium]
MPLHTALVLLGKNIGIGSNPNIIRKDNFHLSNETRLNVLAGGMLYQPDRVIICSSGETTGPPSEARAMKRYLRAHFPNIPEKEIILEEHKNSIDTAGNAEEVAKIVREKGFKHVILVTVGYHLANAATLFERYGVPIEQRIAAEDVVRGRSLRHTHFLDIWEKIAKIKIEKKKELLRRNLLFIDRKGKLVRIITRITCK